MGSRNAQAANILIHVGMLLMPVCWIAVYKVGFIPSVWWQETGRSLSFWMAFFGWLGWLVALYKRWFKPKDPTQVFIIIPFGMFILWLLAYPVVVYLAPSLYTVTRGVSFSTQEDVTIKHVTGWRSGCNWRVTNDRLGRAWNDGLCISLVAASKLGKPARIILSGKETDSGQFVYGVEPVVDVAQPEKLFRSEQ